MGAVSFWSALLSAGLLVTPARAGKLAAWWTNDYGPTLMMQDDASAGLRYSLCNSRDTPVFPNDTSITIPLLKFPPKKNTSLAGGGWWDSKNVIASIFYFDQNDDIVNSLLKCDDRTGHWTNTGDYVISSGSPKAAADSDLSVALLGEKDGYRVLYNSLDGAVQVLTYSNAAGKWTYGNVAYNLSTSANVIASTYPPADTNITLLVPRDNKNMGLARFYGDNTWHLESFPTPLRTNGNNIITNQTNPANAQLNATFVPSYTLPGWNGKPKAMAMAEDSKWTRSVFYIGTDKMLHQVGNLNYNWLVFDSPGTAAWPQADNGYLAVANDFNSDSLRVFYMSKGGLIQANGDAGNWRDAVALPSYSQTTTNTNDTSNDPVAGAGGGASSGLSPGAKAGIGVGVTLAVLAIVGIIVAVVLLKRRQKRKQQAGAAAAASSAGGGTVVGTELGTESKYKPSPEMSYAATTPSEMHSQYTGTTSDGHHYNAQQQQQYAPAPIYELPDQPRRAEMVGEGHYKEAP